MHMADALVSPTVGGVMWGVTAGVALWSARKLRQRGEERLVPLMGVLGAFVFAAQMINFSIPGTGSSGHLGGGILLAVLLGPHAAFIVIASVLAVQALFFADGGLLAFGCNLFNMGFLPAFIAWPLIYRPLAVAGRVRLAAFIAAVFGLQLGALAVVVETTLSGITSLPFTTFLLAMQPIHLAIGLVEGGVTAALLLFIARMEPAMLPVESATRRFPGGKRLFLSLLAAALFTGALLAWYASTSPDGLEWSVARVMGGASLPETADPTLLQRIQQRLAFLPGYGLPVAGGGGRFGTTLAGLVGSLVTLLVIVAIGFILWHRRQRSSSR
ncbi:MAG TPA: energy-coupling factor ABC transporter permease [Geobacterales bacterium]|nr:energy-coupling factor ABC transporter permease [Geobacterales bacterium]